MAKSHDPTRLAGTGHVRQWLCSFKELLAVGIVFLSSIQGPAQTNGSTSSLKSSNRFIFIVETSRAMRPRARGVFEAMKQALDSSLNGQIHQGDQVGIWTFNENIYQVLFPSQEWSQATQLAFAVRLQTFANPEIYVKRARLDKVIPEITRAISESENVTIVLVSSGEGIMQGTPFSAQINSAWKEWHDELEGVHRPLLTALRARKGQPVDWLLTPAPRPIMLPNLATESNSSEEKESNPAGVILESAQVTKKPESMGLVPEQQVAFSVWALGRTSLVNTNGKYSSASSNVEPLLIAGDSAPAIEPPSQERKNVPSNVVATIITSQEQLKSAPAQISPAASEESRPPAETPATRSVWNDPKDSPGDTAKAVELSIVTNAAIPTAAVSERPTAPTKPPETVARLAVASSQPKDFVSGQALLAHARAANPEEKHMLGPGPAPQRNFLRENLNPLVLMIAATFGAAYCFRMWFLNLGRATGSALSLTRANKPE